MNGGPAFPRPSSEAVDTAGQHFWPEAQEGMSLLDWFAGQAMQVILAQTCINDMTNYTVGAVAENAYLLAKAMLKERGELKDKTS